MNLHPLIDTALLILTWRPGVYFCVLCLFYRVAQKLAHYLYAV